MARPDENIFENLGFSEQEAANLQIRSQLMRALAEYIQTEKLTQTQAARRFGVSQPRISDLMRDKIHMFTVDTLINMLTKVNFAVTLNIVSPHEAVPKTVSIVVDNAVEG